MTTIVQIVRSLNTARPTVAYAVLTHECILASRQYDSRILTLFGAQDAYGQSQLGQDQQGIDALSADFMINTIENALSDIPDPIVVIHTPHIYGHLRFIKEMVNWRDAHNVSRHILAQYPSILRVHEFQDQHSEERRHILELAKASDRVIVSSNQDAGLMVAADSTLEPKIALMTVCSNIPQRQDLITNAIFYPTYFGLLAQDRGLEKAAEFVKALQECDDLPDMRLRLVGRIRDKDYFLETVLAPFLQTAYPMRYNALKDKPTNESFVAALNEIDFVSLGIPLECFVNQTETDVARLLGETHFYVNFRDRGATTHSGGIAAALEHDCIIFANHDQDITPALKQCTVPITSGTALLNQLRLLMNEGNTQEGKTLEQLHEATRAAAQVCSSELRTEKYLNIFNKLSTDRQV